MPQVFAGNGEAVFFRAIHEIGITCAVCVQVDEARGDVAAVCIVTYAAGYFIVSRLYADNFSFGNEYGSHSEVTFRSDDFTVINSGYLSFFSFHNSDQ